MKVGEPWQVLADCPWCRTEGAVVEWMDPAHPASHLGIPAERRCRLCRFEERADDGGVVPRHPIGACRCPSCDAPLPEDLRGACPSCGWTPRVARVADALDLRDAGRARQALVRWATEEGEPDLERFCLANMGVPVDEVVSRLVAGEGVGTTFDVIAFLFPGAGGAAGAAPDRPVVVDGRAAAPEAPAPVPRERPAEMDRRTPARVLVSVMVADGTLRSGERAFVLAFLEREGLPPMTADDLRVWRPSELGPPPPPPIRDRLLEAAVHLMHLDRERDGSEWRVIRTFARAWGVPDADLEAWDRRYDRRYGSPMARLGRLLDRLLA